MRTHPIIVITLHVRERVGLTTAVYVYTTVHVYAYSAIMRVHVGCTV